MSPIDIVPPKLIYGIVGLMVTIVMSLSTYALVRVVSNDKALAGLEQWRLGLDNVREKYLTKIDSLEDMVKNQEAALQRFREHLGSAKEDLAVVQNTLSFHSAQLEYVIEWEKKGYSVRPEPLGRQGR